MGGTKIRSVDLRNADLEEGSFTLERIRDGGQSGASEWTS